MKLGLGLDVRKASAPAFKGLLDKFTGAVAAYSTRKLTASQPNILPADYGDGAAAAYSLRKVKASYSGNCIDVRRSSDHEIASIGFSGNELDTTALEAFVNTEHTIADEDFSSSTGWALLTGVSIADGVISFLNSSSSIAAYKDFGACDAVGTKIRVSFTISNYSGSGTIRFVKHGAATFTETGNQGGTERSANGTYTEELTFSSVTTNLNWGLWTSSNFTGDVDDFEVVQITADGFVTKWYDQSGNENDAVDATQETDNDQPQIVDAGSTILENGKPAIKFDGVDDGFTTSLAGSSTFDFYSVIKATSGDDFILPDNYSALTTAYGYIARSDTSTTIHSNYGTPSLYVNGALETPTTRSDVKALLSTGNQLLNVHQGADTSAWSYIEMFRRSGFEFDGTAQEIIIFDSDQSGNRQDIEWNINNHYNIYTDSWDKQSAMEVRRAIDNETTNIGFVGKDLDTTALETFATESSPVLDDYTGAAAAYSLRKVRSAYTGSAVRVRRSSDDELQDIGFDANGDLDTTALEDFVNEDVVKADTDFSSGFADTSENGLDRLANQSIGERSGVLKATIQATPEEHRLIITAVDTGGKTHRLQTSVYIPSSQSGQTVDGFRIENGGLEVYPTTTTKDDWVDIDVTWSSSSNENIFIKFLPSGGAESWTGNGTDEVYIGDVTITQTTADGAVTAWYDQTVPTETYVSDFSGGVDGFSATDSSNNTVTRLASVTDNYSTTVENVLQFEAATAGTGIEQQLRNNLPLTVGGTYKVSFKMLIDSGNTTLVRAGLYDGAGTTPEDIVFGGKLTETGRWTTFTDVPITQGSVELFFAGLDSSDSFSFNSTVGDKFYIADVSVDEVNDATQTTADNQPLIVSGGTVTQFDSINSIQFNGTSHELAISLSLSTTAFSSFSVAGTDGAAGTNAQTIFGSNATDFYSQIRSYDLETRISSSPILTLDDDIGDNPNQMQLLASINGTSQGNQYIDGTIGNRSPLDTSSSGGISETSVYIGSSNGQRYLGGGISEIIIFDSDQSANRTGIEGNIGRYYNIDGFRDVFVTKWYDQSGNFNHAENSTSTEQPQIVDGGSVITEGTTPKAALDFDGVNDAFAISVGITSGFAVFGVYKNTKDGSYLLGSPNAQFGRRGTSEYRFHVAGSFSTNGGAHSNNQVLFTGIEDTANATIYANGIQQAQAASVFSSDTLTLISRVNVLGNIQEIIIFNSNQSSNRTDIESNINKHFKIYE